MTPLERCVAALERLLDGKPSSMEYLAASVAEGGKAIRDGKAELALNKDSTSRVVFGRCKLSSGAPEGLLEDCREHVFAKAKEIRS